MKWARVGVALGLVTVLGVPRSAADDRAVQLLEQARVALGGAALEKVTAVAASGELRRMFGEREIGGDLTIELAAPGRIKRTEELGFPGGSSMTRIVALNAGEYWEDATNRGAAGFMRIAPGVPGGPRRGREPTEEDRARFREMQKRRLAGELRRYQLVWLLRTDGEVSYAGTAEAEDGRAEVLEIGAEKGEPMRLFLDTATGQPLMISFEGFMPRMRMMQRGPGRSPPAGQEQAGNEPPERVTFELRVDDYRSVDGVFLPHRFTQSVDGVATEEWTIGKYKLNPSFKKGTFEKP